VKIALLNSLIWTSTGLVCMLLSGIVVCILYKGLPHITCELLTSKPSLLNGTVGILPNILNTLYIILITLIVVFPLGVGSAIYLNEYAKNKNVVKIIELAVVYDTHSRFAIDN